jgi:hypothetical protein
MTKPVIEILIGTLVCVSGMWQMFYDLPAKGGTLEFKGHHTLILFGFFIALNSLLRLFKGMEQIGRAEHKVLNNRMSRFLDPVRLFMGKWYVELLMGLVLLLGGVAELFEVALGIDGLQTAEDNDMLWFVALLILGGSLLVKSLASVFDTLKVSNQLAKRCQLEIPKLRSIDRFMHRPVVVATLAIAIAAIGLWHELMDSTSLFDGHLEPHHGLLFLGMQHFMKLSEDISDSIELAEEAIEEKEKELEI